ncbi:MAG: TolC family protein [Bacteroidetes Order II. Incertae sedis bacterium]|nr:TolC family protein [Bacteroidetes Order II. bacterium]
MKQAFFIWSCLFLLLLGTIEASAQVPQKLTLRQAILTALGNSVALKKTENAVSIQRVAEAQALDAFLPSAQVSANLNPGYGRSFDQTTINFSFSPSISGGASVSGGLLLWQGGYWNRLFFGGNEQAPTYLQAKRQTDASELTVRRARENIIFAVASGYLDVIRNQEQIRVVEENLAAQKQQLARIQQFVRGGVRAESDMLQQQALVAQAELQVLNQQLAFERAKTRLIQSLEVDPFVVFEFEVPDIGTATLLKENYDVEAMIRTALQNRMDIQAQKATIEANQMNMDLIRANRLPTLTLGGSVSTQYSSRGNDNIFRQVLDNRNFGLGFSLSWNIYDRNQVRRSLQIARYQSLNAVLDLRNLEQSVASEVRQAYLDYLNADKQVQVAAVQVNYRKQALDVEQNRYNLGASTLTELAQMRAGLVEAQSQEIQARYGLVFQKQVLEYYIGRIKPEMSLIPNSK